MHNLSLERLFDIQNSQDHLSENNVLLETIIDVEARLANYEIVKFQAIRIRAWEIGLKDMVLLSWILFCVE